MKRKGYKIILLCIVLLTLYTAFDIYSHSTIERAIRTDLFLKGYFVKAFKTEIFERPISDTQYGAQYFCNNPAIGPDSYDIDYKYSYLGKVKYWYINWAGTGGG